MPSVIENNSLYKGFISLLLSSSLIPWPSTYRVCHGFRLTKPDDYFWVNVNPFCIEQFFKGSWGSIENWFDPKTEPPSGSTDTN